MREVDRAVELLTPLFKGLAEERDDTVNVSSVCRHGEKYITVAINQGKYEINVTGENLRLMVHSVVNKVALKF